MTKRLQPHPAADLFPMMSPVELDQLAADIRQRGQLQPIIVTKDDLVLDGRNRLEACRRVEVEPYVLLWDQEDDPTASPTAFVLSANLRRRHLNESQRALVAAEALPMFEVEARKRMGTAAKKGKGVPRGTPLEEPKSPPVEPAAEAKKPKRAAAAAAEAAGASSRSVARAKAVLEKRPELREQIREAKITLKQAEKAIRKEEQVKNVLEYRPPVGTYAVIVADVPWRYDDQLDGSDQARGGTGYPTMALEEICAIKPPAAPDCALWFWVTNAFLMDGSAARVLQAWGFESKALLTWRKVDKAGNDRLGSGHYLRNVTEHAILAVRGRPVIVGSEQPNIFDAPRTARHSEKPARFFEIAERVTPCAPEARIELFAVDPRVGWVTSGSEQQAKARAARAGDRAGWVGICYCCDEDVLRDTGGLTSDALGIAHNACLNGLTPKESARRRQQLSKARSMRELPIDDGTLCGIRPSKNGDGCIHKQGHEGIHSNGRTTWRDRKGKLPASLEPEPPAKKPRRKLTIDYVDERTAAQ